MTRGQWHASGTVELARQAWERCLLWLDRCREKFGAVIWGGVWGEPASLCLKGDKYLGKVGRWIVWQLDTAVLQITVSPAVMVLMVMVLTVVVSAIGVLTTAVLVVSSPRKPWGAGGHLLWATLLDVPVFVQSVPCTAGTYKGSRTALLPVWAGGSGAGDLCPPLSILRTLFPRWPRCP